MRTLGFILWGAAVAVAILAVNWCRALTGDSTSWEAFGANGLILLALFLANISGSMSEFARHEEDG